MKEKIIFRDVEGALALECIVKIYNIASSEYIRRLILQDVQNIFHRTIKREDLLHGFEIHIVDHVNYSKDPNEKSVFKWLE
jgi:hypothetical protein